MDVTKLTRDVAAVRSTLVDRNDVLISKTGCSIVVPSTFVNKNLAVLSKKATYILGVFAMVIPSGKYCLFSFPNMCRIHPSDTRRFFHEGVEYIQFDILPGAPALMDMNVLIQDTLIYNIYSFFVDGGVIPWYMNYLDAMTVFDLVPKYIGVNLGDNWTIIKVILSNIARQQDDRTKRYRELLTDASKAHKLKPAYVQFSSILYGPKTTSAKIGGPYFDIAMLSALNNPSVQPDNIERYLGS